MALVAGRGGLRHGLSGFDEMSSNGSAVGAGAGRALRVGVIGAGIMGSNHARVLAGLPGIELVGIVDPLPAHRVPRDRTDRLPDIRWLSMS